MSGLQTVLHALVIALMALFSTELSDPSVETNQFPSEIESVQSLREYFSGYIILTPATSSSFFASKNVSPGIASIWESTANAVWFSISDQCAAANHITKVRLLKIIYPFHSFW